MAGNLNSGNPSGKGCSNNPGLKVNRSIDRPYHGFRRHLGKGIRNHSVCWELDANKFFQNSVLYNL